jgi:hypothetical protein
MVDGSGGNSSSMVEFNPTAITSSTAGSATIIENVAELQFGPDFEDIHSTLSLVHS